MESKMDEIIKYKCHCHAKAQWSIRIKDRVVDVPPLGTWEACDAHLAEGTRMLKERVGFYTPEMRVELHEHHA